MEVGEWGVGGWGGWGGWGGEYVKATVMGLVNPTTPEPKAFRTLKPVNHTTMNSKLAWRWTQASNVFVGFRV